MPQNFTAPLPLSTPLHSRFRPWSWRSTGLLLFGLSATPLWADAIFTPGDSILGGQENTATSEFQIGSAGTNGNANNWPAGESPDHAIDGVAAKYLNFGKTYTGFLVNPTYNGGNGSVATSMQLWTANDAVDRDPASYEIWGTNTTLDFSATTFSLSSFTQISTGSLTLPAGRGGTGTAPLNDANSQTVNFVNAVGFKEYLIVFPTVKNSGTNSMQIGEVQLFGTAAFSNLTWTGSVNSIWDKETTPNFSNGGTASTYSDSNGVIFDDTAQPTHTNITISAGGGGVKPASVIFQNNSLDYTIGGESITSVGSLNLSGTGTVTLNNANDFAVGTNVTAGTLNVGATGSLGAGALRLNNSNTGAGTAIAVNFASPQSIGSLSGTVAVPSSGDNSATIHLAGDLTVKQSTEGIFAGTITGTGGLIKEGDAALTLTAPNSYTGTTVVNAGILRSSAPGDQPLGALPAGQPVVVNAGAKLIFGTDDGAGYHAGSVSNITVNGGTVVGAVNTHSTLPAVTLNGGTLTALDTGNLSNGVLLNYILDGTVTSLANAAPSQISAPTILLRQDPQGAGITNAVTFNVARGTGPVDLSITSTILDQGAGLIKTGAGVLALTNASTYTGPTVVNGGTIRVANSSAMGTGDVALSGGTVLSLAANTSYNGFGDFSLNGGAAYGTTTSSLALTDNGGNEARSAFSNSTVSLVNGFNANFVYTASGNRAADGFAFAIQNVSPTAVGAAGGSLGYVGIPNSAAVEFNIYTNGGLLPIGTNYAIGTAGSYIASTPVNLASGNPIAITLNYNPAQQTLTETLVDQLTAATYTNVFSGVDLPAALGGSTNGYIGFTGGTGGLAASQEVGNFSFTNYAQGVALTNNLALANGATVGVEVLPVVAGGAGTATLLGQASFGPNSTLNITGGPTITDTAYNLTMSGQSTMAGNLTIDVANNGTGVGLAVLTGPLGQTVPSTLTKTGDGTLALNGAATYSGTTAVNGGTLLVNGSLSGALTTVANNATLGGTGTLGAVTIANGGTLSPGDGLGTLQTGPLTMQNNSSLRLEVGDAMADQVKITGAGSLNGVINLLLVLTADPTDGQTLTILDGSAALTGYASGARFSYLGTALEEGQQFSVTDHGFTQVFAISYAADAGKDVTLLAVPEPSCAILLLAGCGAALGWRRRPARVALGSYR